MVYFPDKRELDKDHTEFPLNTFFYGYAMHFNWVLWNNNQRNHNDQSEQT